MEVKTEDSKKGKNIFFEIRLSVLSKALEPESKKKLLQKYYNFSEVLFYNSSYFGIRR